MKKIWERERERGMVSKNWGGDGGGDERGEEEMKRNGNCYCFVFALMSSSSIAESFFITLSFNHNNTDTQEI